MIHWISKNTHIPKSKDCHETIRLYVWQMTCQEHDVIDRISTAIVQEGLEHVIQNWILKYNTFIFDNREVEKIMKNYYRSIQNAFEQRHSLIIIGLTGRTGSGCSTTANILATESFDLLHLKDPKTLDFQSRDERKYEVIYKYIKAEDHWKPFSIISGSDIIFSFILEYGFDQLLKYISQFRNVIDDNDVRISAFDEVENIIRGMTHLFQNEDLYNVEENLDTILSEVDQVEKYYDFYLKKLPRLKREFNDALKVYTCHKAQINRFEQPKYVRSNLYTFLMQEVGNNIRCSGKPYSNEYTENDFYNVAKRIDAIIKIIEKHNKNAGIFQTRICIDAIRNPYEAYFFKDKYSSFYLISINTKENERRKRLGHLDEEEIQSLDETEFEAASQTDYGIFSHQTIPECLSISDIHLYNPDVNDGRFLFLTEQIIKYIALMLHPGLINPTHIERCMQSAYVASLNSGCLSRQVGAVITGPDFSIKAVGWNDVPEGQVSCNLRCTMDYCKNKDFETYSCFELEDSKFQEALFSINQEISQCDYPDLGGMTYSYCFKDIYNEIKGGIKNQVFTRALHAEENAFLQLSKNGGQGIKGGKLFSTASPCELCSKKAYQLGIEEIYYIDPYPGISTHHILSFGKSRNPAVNLFYGAIGSAYVKLYTPRIPLKDELQLRSGVNCRKVVNSLDKDPERSLGIKDFKYIDLQDHFIFHSRTEITENSKIKIEALRDGIERMTRCVHWTGSSFEGFELIQCNKRHQFKNLLPKKSAYTYILTFDEALKKSDQAEWEIKASMKDTRRIMIPYYSQTVAFKIDHLSVTVSAPKGLLENVEKVIYADKLMSKDLEVSRELLSPEITEFGEKFTFDVNSPNLMYSYSIEWKFNES